MIRGVQGSKCHRVSFEVQGHLEKFLAATPGSGDQETKGSIQTETTNTL